MSDDRIEVRAGVATDKGRVRSNNQDSFLLLPDRGLWVVADGMGGAQGGEVASRLAVETFEDAYEEQTEQSLAEVVAEANHRIYEAAASTELRGMGTTAVGLALVSDDGTESDRQHLVVVNVGDSRAYLYRDGGLTQLTDDHSVVAELVRDGRITAEEADVHPQRNVITRVLGVYPEVAADLWPIDPVRGDRYLLCSDGLFNEVGDDQMAAVLRRLGDPSEAAAELVRLANEGGGRDNITVIVLDVLEDGGVAERASAGMAGTVGHDSDDLAGFSRAIDDDRLSDDDLDGVLTPSKRTRRERKAQRKADRTGRSRVTWRVLLFTILLLAVLGGALATIQWYGTSTYFVAFDDDEVAIYQGRPGGLLWIDPELEESTGIARQDVPARYADDLDAGHELSSLADARQFVSNIERDVSERSAATTTTTTTAPPATTVPTTVAPPAAPAP